MQRALDRIVSLINRDGSPVLTHGPLIHNEIVLNVLRKRGVRELDRAEDPAGKTVVIRAHGVSPAVLDELKRMNVTLCNATCPKVAQVQVTVKKFSEQGYTIVIVGDRGHAEVEGLLGYAPDRSVAVSGKEDIALIPTGGKICVVAQTTQSRTIYEETVAEIRSRFSECLVFDTICDATAERQKETIELARKSDLMIVVGSNSSANTKRLADICRAECRTLLINSADDLNYDMLKDARRIGVTAGASTPAWVISKVVDRVRRIGWYHSRPVFRAGWRILETLYHTQALFGLSVAAMAVGLVNLIGISPSPGHAYIVLWGSLFWSVINMLADRRDRQSGDDRFIDPVRRHQNRAYALFGMLSVPALILAGSHNIGSGLLVLLFAFLVVLYTGFESAHLTLPPGFGPLRKSPFQRNAAAGFMIALIAVAYPMTATASASLTGWIYFLFVMLLIWIRMTLLDLRTIQMDMISGNTTLPVRLGIQNTFILTYAVLGFWLLISLVPIFLESVGPPRALLALVPLYYLGYLFNFQHRLILLSMTSDASADVGLILTAVLVWMASLFPF